eukprot:gene980-biopygen233
MSLLEDDAEHTRCLEDAAIINMPAHMRQLFATLILFQTPSDINALFTEFQEDIAEDFVRHDQLQDPNATFQQQHIHMCLADIQKNLHIHGKSLQDFPEMPQLPADWLTKSTSNRNETANARATQPRTTANTQRHCPRHREAVNRQLFLSRRSSENWQNLPVQHIGTQYASFRTQSQMRRSSNTTPSRQNSTLDISNTDSSAQQFHLQCQSTKSPSTTTARHNAFHMGRSFHDSSNSTQTVDHLLRDITKIDRTFGGKYFMLGGNFRQVLPVVKKAGRERAVQECLKSRKVEDLWSHFQQFRLIANMRAVQHETYQAFSDWLLRIGNGVQPHDHQDHISLLQQICIKYLENLMNSIYPEAESADAHLLLDPNTMSERCCLTPKNKFSHHINELILQRLPTPQKQYLSVDTVQTDDPEKAAAYPISQFTGSL